MSDVLTFNASLSQRAPSAPVFLSGLILHDVAPFCHCFVVAASLPVSALSVMNFSRTHSTNVLLPHLSYSLDLIIFGTMFFILLQRQCTHVTFEVQCCEQRVNQQHQSQRFGNLIAALVSGPPPQLFHKNCCSVFVVLLLSLPDIPIRLYAASPILVLQLVRLQHCCCVSLLCSTLAQLLSALHVLFRLYPKLTAHQASASPQRPCVSLSLPATPPPPLRLLPSRGLLSEITAPFLSSSPFAIAALVAFSCSCLLCFMLRLLFISW